MVECQYRIIHQEGHGDEKRNAGRHEINEGSAPRQRFDDEEPPQLECEQSQPINAKRVEVAEEKGENEYRRHGQTKRPRAFAYHHPDGKAPER